ncbi:MAG: hypothetical protein KDA75_06395 [Planctomycetaceae bacterium]|nr:hypothetical protein [Planctomycetaceae bacterium]
MPFPFQFLTALLLRRFGPFALRDGGQLVRFLAKSCRLLFGALSGEHLRFLPQSLGPFESFIGEETLRRKSPGAGGRQN